MTFFVIGTNHQFSPVGFRERLAFSKSTRRDALALLKEKNVLNGAVIVSTCNRVEIYASARDPQEGIRAIMDFLSEYKEINRSILHAYLYTFTGREALRHLLKVCAGLDSLILGEMQVSGQVRMALDEAQNAGFVDETLTDIFQAATANTKKIHAGTKIFEGKVSVGSVAVDFVKQRTGPLAGKNILIVGVGKVTELVLKYLREERPSVIFVSSRTFDKAKALAESIGGRAIRFDRLREGLKSADIVITATASPHCILKKETFAGIERPLFIVDLGMPRDVDPEVAGMRSVELYTLEDLDGVIKANKDQKEEEGKKALAIIDHEINFIWKKFSKLEREEACLL